MKQKLKYRFHNPNPAEVAADYILKVLIAANQPKADNAVLEAKKRKIESLAKA